VEICIVNYLYIVLNINCFSIFCLGLINWYQSMATNHERIESLDTNVYVVKDGIQQLEEGATSSIDCMQRIEDALKEISTLLSVSHGTMGRQPFGTYEQGGPSRGVHRTGENGQQGVVPRYAKMDFPRFQGDDPTEWLNRVVQFFDYHGTPQIKRWCWHLSIFVALKS
jgi:hypothetical protein